MRPTCLEGAQLPGRGTVCHCQHPVPTCPSPVVTYMSFWCKQAPSSCSSCNAHTWRMGPDWAWEAPFPSMGPPGSPRGGMLPSSKGHKSFVLCPPVTPSGLEGAGLLPRRAGTGQSCLFRPRLPYSHVWRGRRHCKQLAVATPTAAMFP